MSEAAAAEVPIDEIADHDESLVDIVAAKVLFDWLRNRQQLLIPFTLDFRKLDVALVETLVHAMVATACAGGERADRARERLTAAFTQLHATEGHEALLSQTLEAPQPLCHTLQQVSDGRTAAMVYAVALLAADRRRLVDRQFLRYLALRLELSRDVARALERRFRSTV